MHDHPSARLEPAQRRELGDLNPYAPPQTPGRAPSEGVLAPPSYHHALALAFVLGSIALSLAYTYCDEVLIGTSGGAWPMLFGTLAISLVAAAWTKNWMLAPLCCFAGVMSGDLLAALVRSWAYAQFHLCIPLAIGFSMPALVLAAALDWRRRSKQSRAR